ncbi:hypothetical protein N9B71_05765, partial [Pirellulales bacterium]|nr:hypothetical protein [Pirellulales bacterium]
NCRSTFWQKITIQDYVISRRNWPTLVDSLRFATLTMQEILFRKSSVNSPNAIAIESWVIFVMDSVDRGAKF